MKPHATDEPVRSMARVRDEGLAGFAAAPAAQNLMQEIMTEEVHAGPEPHGTGHGRAGKPGRFGLPGLGIRLVAVGTLAAVAVGAISLRADEDGPTPSPPPTATIPLGSAAEASHVLDQAAEAAENRKFAPAKPDQWVYTKKRHTASATPSGGVTGGPYKTVTWELWRRVDGKQYAAYQNGKLQIGDESLSSSKVAQFDPLPSDPDALLRKVGGGSHDFAFDMLITILSDSVHSPETEAAIFRAIKRIPGVTPVEGAVDIGRPAIALGRTVEGWLHEEVLLDPKTYAYLGERAITIKTHTSGGEGEAKRTVKAGTLARLIIRDAVAVVDEPGQRS